MAELMLNGIVEEEVRRYYHICFFTDKKGPDLENEDNYIFVPKVICRIVDDMTVCIQDWYVYKKNLSCFIRYRRRPLQIKDQKKDKRPYPSSKDKFYTPHQTDFKSFRK